MADKEDIAIIGMSCIFPGAPDIQTYWQNIFSKVDAVGDPPEDWESELFYDPGSDANDRIFCKRGGYIADMLKFNPAEFGVMPKVVDGSDPDHFVGLMVAKAALDDAGYLEQSFDGRRCELIIGRGTYINRGFVNQIYHCFVVDETIRLLRRLHPEHSEAELELIKRTMKEGLPSFTAENVGGLVPNVMAGRIANRFNLMGVNYTVDAACASSLVALEHGVRDLRQGQCDMALVGGANVATTPPMLNLFCMLNALSRKEQIRPFSASADGTLLGEGYGMVVLKRRSDAERDGDRIYSLIKGVGSSSDGRALSVLAPRLEGEVLAIQRAFENAGDLSPHSLGMIEAHGTGTTVGDATEAESLRSVFGERTESEHPYLALGTVKSMISHLIPAAGIAGLIKTSLALYHKVLPPTLHCEDPSPALKLEISPFYLNTETRPWIHGQSSPRRAGVNAFGFGGINGHAILEEAPEPKDRVRPNLHDQWDSEAIVLQGDNRAELLQAIDRLARFIAARPDVALKDVAAACSRELRDTAWRLGVVADSLEDLGDKLVNAQGELKDPDCKRIRNAAGIYFTAEPLGKEGKLAFLFPGEGAQYLNMLADLCLHFPELREWFDLMDRAFVGHQRGFLPSQIMFPPPQPGADEGSDDRLFDMDSAVEAVFAANQAMALLVRKLGIRADMMLGHSTGEYSALMAAGVIQVDDEEQLIGHMLDLNELYEDALEQGLVPSAVLMSVASPDLNAVEAAVAESTGPLYLSMDNCPHQVVLCGTEETTAAAAEKLGNIGAVCQTLPFDRAYHTPLFRPFCKPLERFFSSLTLQSPTTPVYTTVTAAPLPDEREEIKRLAVDQWASPVRFRETAEAMYQDGVRVFLEVGPRGNLSAFIDDIFRGRPHLALRSNLPTRSGIRQLNHMVAQLAVHGVELDFEYLYQRRNPLALDLDELRPAEKKTMPGEMKLSTYLCSARIPKDAPILDQLAAAAKARRSTLDPAQQAKPGQAQSTEQEAGGEQRNDSRFQVMGSYMQTMEKFLSTQEQILQRAMAGKAVASPPAAALETVDQTLSKVPTSKSLERPDYPLVGDIVSLREGESLVFRREISMEKDIFLLHHTIGNRKVAADPSLTALPVVPLTMSMEIMAEAAVYLVPDKCLVGMREVRGYRWVGLDKGVLTLEVVATRQPDAAEDQVEVRVFELTGGNGAGRFLVIEGKMLLDDAYALPPESESAFAIREEHPSRWHGDVRYQDGMFHGPAFQAVERVDRTGPDGTEATLKVLPSNTLFKNISAPALVVDPVVLDAAGQVIGYWALEHLKTGYNAFPFRLERLHIFRENPPAHESLVCRARVTHLDESEIRSDIDLIDSNGRLWMRLDGWWDRRFDMPLPFYRFRITPLDVVLSRDLPEMVAHLDEPGNFRCCVLDAVPQELLLTGWMIWARVLAHMILTADELRQWWSLELPNAQKCAWLLKRTVAKDAVRTLLKERFGLVTYPADIGIDIENGRPKVKGAWLSQLPAEPLLAWSYSQGVAVSVACVEAEAEALGLALQSTELLSEQQAVAQLNAAERGLLETVAGGLTSSWLHRVATARQAYGQVIGTDRIADINDLRIIRIDSDNGFIHLQADDLTAEALPPPQQKPVLSATRDDSGLVLALVVGDKTA